MMETNNTESPTDVVSRVGPYGFQVNNKDTWISWGKKPKVELSVGDEISLSIHEWKDKKIVQELTVVSKANLSDVPKASGGIYNSKNRADALQRATGLLQLAKELGILNNGSFKDINDMLKYHRILAQNELDFIEGKAIFVKDGFDNAKEVN